MTRNKHELADELADELLADGLTTDKEVELYTRLRAYANNSGDVADIPSAEDVAKTAGKDDVSEYVGRLHHSNGETEPLTDDLKHISQPKGLEAGDMVRDKDPEKWMVKANKNMFTVESVTDIPADEYELNDYQTVASVNQLEPDKAPVIEVTRDAMNKTLAYPATRLEKVE